MSAAIPLKSLIDYQDNRGTTLGGLSKQQISICVLFIHSFIYIRQRGSEKWICTQCTVYIHAHRQRDKYSYS